MAVVGPETGEEDVGADIEVGREDGAGRGGVGHCGRWAACGGVRAGICEAGYKYEP